jgi:UDP-glucose 4-epimerase
MNWYTLDLKKCHVISLQFVLLKKKLHNIFVRALVTGGAGFIGSSLCEYLLKKNFKVIVIDNLKSGNINNLKNIKKNIVFIKVDISQKEKLQDKYFRDIDVIFHMAALADIVPSINNPEDYYKSNVQGTLNLLEKARKHKVKKFIYAASSSCYGLPKKLPVLEKAIISPQYPYALTKYLGEQLVLHWAKVYKMKNISLRFFNVYGPRSRTNTNYGAMFGVFLAQKLNNKPLTIVGNGKQTRDFLFISDLIEGIYKSWKYGKSGQIFNLASGKEVSVIKIANLMSHKIKFIPKRPGEPDKLRGDISKAIKQLKWKPKISIEKGVEIMLNNIKNWSKAPIWTPKLIKKETKSWFKYLK